MERNRRGAAKRALAALALACALGTTCLPAAAQTGRPVAHPPVEVALPERMDAIRDQLNALSDEELLSLLAAGDIEQSLKRSKLAIALAATAAGGAVLLTLLLLRRYRRRKTLTDALTGLGTLEGYQTVFRTLPREQIHLYYVVYLAAELRTLNRAGAQAVQQQTAQLLAKEIGIDEMVIRLGEGTFAVLCQCADPVSAKRRMSRVLSHLENGLDSLFPAPPRFRAGIVPLSKEDWDAESVLDRARWGWSYAQTHDLSLCLADQRTLARENRRLRLRQALPGALERGEFKLYVQLVVQADSGRFCGGECLSRWQEPEEGLILPREYIQEMTEDGIIHRLDLSILEQTCAVLERWHREGRDELWLACNFSRQTLSRADFQERFFALLDRFTFRRDRLVLELTEDVLVEDEVTTVENLQACRAAGFRVALDDMGSGYAALRDLGVYPLDLIKLDREFFLETRTEQGAALLEGLVRMAHEMRLQVLCEGACSEEERRDALRAGCDFIQSFYYSRVMPLEQALALLKEHKTPSV